MPQVTVQPQKEVDALASKIDSYLKNPKAQSLDKTRDHIFALIRLERSFKTRNVWVSLPQPSKLKLEQTMGKLRALESKQAVKTDKSVVPVKIKPIKFKERKSPPTISTTDTKWQYPDGTEAPFPPPILTQTLGAEAVRQYYANIPGMMNGDVNAENSINDLLAPAQGDTNKQKDILFGYHDGVSDQHLDAVLDLLKQGKFQEAVNYATENNLDRGGLLTMVGKGLGSLQRTIHIPTRIFNVGVKMPLIIYENLEAYERKHSFANLTVVGGANFSWLSGNSEVTTFSQNDEQLVESVNTDKFSKFSHYYDLGLESSFNLFHQTFTPSLYGTLGSNGDLSLRQVGLKLGHPRNPVFSNLQDISFKLERPRVLGPIGMAPGEYQLSLDTTVMIPLGSTTAIALAPGLQFAPKTKQFGASGAAFFKYQNGVWRFGAGYKVGKVPGAEGIYHGPSVSLMDVASFSPTFYTNAGAPVSYNFSLNIGGLISRIRGE